jgi:Na+-transporting NADH:ubiquinone oxidoreductase subunit C
MVIVVGAVLALTSMALKDRQNENAQADKKSQILQAVHISTERSTVIADFDKYIVKQLVVNSKGKEVEGLTAFDIDVATEAKKPADERLLPIYVCELPDAGTKYILPLAGMGLWGQIWGYVAFDADGSTVYGAFFGHQSETPGLGAEITKPAFTDQFPGKQIFKGTDFLPIEVVKKGQKPQNEQVDYVDGISGGTITSKGVSTMFNNCLAPYEAWFRSLGNADTAFTDNTAELLDGQFTGSNFKVLTAENAKNDDSGKSLTDKISDDNATAATTAPQVASSTDANTQAAKAAAKNNPLGKDKK